MLRHVSVELSMDGDWTDESWERNLVSVGYHNTRPSIWAMEGLQTLSEGLKVILRCVSSLATYSIFLRELRCSVISDIPQEPPVSLAKEDVDVYAIPEASPREKSIPAPGHGSSSHRIRNQLSVC